MMRLDDILQKTPLSYYQAFRDPVNFSCKSACHTVFVRKYAVEQMAESAGKVFRQPPQTQHQSAREIVSIK